MKKLDIKKYVYICSPCRGDYEKNIDNAISYSRIAFLMGYIPITPHIYFTRFMDDTNTKERNMAMNAGKELLTICSEVWVFGLDNPSEGMQEEIALAIRRKIPIEVGEEMIEKGRKIIEEEDAFIKKLKETRDLKKNDDSTHNPSDFDILCAIRDIESWLLKNCGVQDAEEWRKSNEDKIKLLISKYQNGENHESV